MAFKEKIFNDISIFTQKPSIMDSNTLLTNLFERLMLELLDLLISRIWTLE